MLQTVVEAFHAADQSTWHMPLCTLLLIGLLVSWRIWSFTIKPALFSEHPKELPYWIPWLGHAPAFVSDGQNLIRRGRLYFGNTKEPFFLTLGGQRIYVLTAANDVAQVYHDTEAFTFDKAVSDVTHQFGASKATCVAVYQRPASFDEDPATKAGFRNPSLKSIAHLNSDYLRLQLLPGPQFDIIASKLTELMHMWVSNEHLCGDPVLAASSDSTEKTVSFYSWSKAVLLQVASRAIFGPELLAQSQSLFSDFFQFDDENWRLWYRVPGSQDVVAARDRVTDAFEKYISLPRNERLEMAPVVDYYERNKRAKGIPERDIATVISMLHFASNTNTFKLSFWIIANLLHHPEALEQVKSEIATAFDSKTNKLSLQPLLDSCPFLNAVFDETLRLCSANASIRTTTKSTWINNKLIPADSQIICPFRELHWNSDVWGEDPSVWDPTRFLKNRALAKNSSYRPFGGGLSYCPGRFLARAEALLFVSLVLLRFDIQLEPGQTFPRYDSKPNPALMAPVRGDDLIVTVKEKA